VGDAEENIDTYEAGSDKKLGGKIHRQESYKLYPLLLVTGVRGSAFGLGTAIQAGRTQVRFPMVSLEFFIDIILLASLWSWD
jgi:hypothetical protein